MVAWLVKQAGVPVPIPQVVEVEATMKKVEKHLLPFGVGAEVHGCLRRPWASRKRKGHSELSVNQAPLEHPADLCLGVSQAVLLDFLTSTGREQQGIVH